jgi:hypothetical protein
MHCAAAAAEQRHPCMTLADQATYSHNQFSTAYLYLNKF